MPRRVLLLVFVVALTPLAAAGPLEDSPLAGHARGCAHNEGSWQWEQKNGTTKEGAWSSWDSETCGEWHWLNATEEGDVVGVRVWEYDVQRNASSSSGSWRSGPNGGSSTRYDDGSSGRTEAFLVDVEAPGHWARVYDVCQDRRSMWTVENKAWSGWSSTSEKDSTARETEGCGRGAQAFSAEAATEIRVDAFDGCEGETWSNDRRASHDGGVTEDQVLQEREDAFCGTRYTFVAGEDELQLAKGGACTSDSTTTRTSSSDTYANDATCTEGLALAVPGTYVLVGSETRTATRCSSGSCMHEEETFEGTSIRVFDLRQDVPVAGLTQVLP